MTKHEIETADTKPTACEVIAANIPTELKEQPRWVCWKYERRGDKWTKVPIDPKSGANAKSTAATTWCDFNTACEYFKAGNCDGIGFVLGDGFAGVDLDDCRDTATGKYEPWAKEIITKFVTYTEESPSGTGCKIFLRGEVPQGGNRKGKIEIYGKARYFTITGKKLDRFPDTVRECQEQLDALHASLFAKPATATPSNGTATVPVNAPVEAVPVTGTVRATGTTGLTDTEVIRRALQSKQADTFGRLWKGELNDHTSHSEADQSLCGHLAFWCGRDADQIDRLFRQSGLFRDKWERADYRQRTIDHAIAGCVETYTPRVNTKPVDTSPAIDTTDSQFQPFPLDALPPGAVRDYVIAAAGAIGCDPAFVAVPMLSALAGAVGNTRAIEVKKGWKEPCVIWTATVADSGTHKSPALEAAMRPLRERQNRSIQIWQEEMGRRQADDPSKPPRCERFIVSDCTVESLACVLGETPRGLLLVRDELGGWLNGMNQYKGGKGADVGHYLEMHRANPLLVDRKAGPVKLVHVPRAAVSITGGIQPGALARALGVEHLEDGLAARFAFTMPPRQRRVWTERAIPETAEKAIDTVFDGLLSLTFDFAHADNRPVVMNLSDQAKAVFVDFYNEHAAEQMELTGELAAAWSKLEGYAARFAMLLELTVWATTIGQGLGPHTVRGPAMQAAVKLVRWFANEARRVYGVLGEQQQQREQRQLIEWISNHGGTVTASEARKGMRRFRDSTEGAELALSELVKAGIGEWVGTETNATGGRPTTRFRLLLSTKPQ